MENYSISQVSRLLNISRDTLRYYDKIGLVSPLRGENKYRYYTEEEITQLQYLKVMKYGGLSLSEIKVIFHNMNTLDKDCTQDTILMLDEKYLQTQKKIRRLQDISDLLSLTVDKLKKKKRKKDMNELIKSIFKQIENEE